MSRVRDLSNAGQLLAECKIARLSAYANFLVVVAGRRCVCRYLTKEGPGLNPPGHHSQGIAAYFALQNRC